MVADFVKRTRADILHQRRTDFDLGRVQNALRCSFESRENTVMSRIQIDRFGICPRALTGARANAVPALYRDADRPQLTAPHRSAPAPLVGLAFFRASSVLLHRRRSSARRKWMLPLSQISVRKSTSGRHPSFKSQTNSSPIKSSPTKSPCQNVLDSPASWPMGTPPSAPAHEASETVNPEVST
eukprot:3671953-Pleurochrysis_carterae.AAC.1